MGDYITKKGIRLVKGTSGEGAPLLGEARGQAGDEANSGGRYMGGN